MGHPNSIACVPANNSAAEDVSVTGEDQPHAQHFATWTGPLLMALPLRCIEDVRYLSPPSRRHRLRAATAHDFAVLRPSDAIPPPVPTTPAHLHDLARSLRSLARLSQGKIARVMRLTLTPSLNT